MFFCGLLGDQQDKQQIHRTAIRRIEGYRRGEAQESTSSVLESFNTAMWYGNTLTKTGGAQFLTCKQTVENHRAGKPEVVLEEHSRLFENTFLAAGLKVKKHLRGRQNCRYGVHRGF